jgi:hypothetical protein
MTVAHKNRLDGVLLSEYLYSISETLDAVMVGVSEKTHDKQRDGIMRARNQLRELANLLNLASMAD